MRIQGFHLLRYGRFTDRHLPLPRSESDIHIVFGPNEAGKSTALSAIEDLLFGIPGNSRYNFLHDYGSMRVGAILESGGKTLEFRRRKGNKDTLLTAQEVPIAGGTGALVPFLAGADQTFFTRMFSLDHERLRRGGREILEAQDEVGQMLFSAGAGLSGLRERLNDLTREADSLWASRKAAHRKYYQALDRLDGADKALREHMVTASKWHEVKRSYDDAQETYDVLEKQNEEITREQRKLSRIRRVYKDVRRTSVLDDQIKALGEVIALPEDASSTLDDAEREQLSATTRVDTLNERLETEQKQRENLECNEELLLREDDIQEFHKRRIEIQKENLDLPRRRADLASEEKSLRRLAEELGWKGDDIDTLVKRIPPRAKVNVLRALISSRGERLSSAGNAKTAVDELASQIGDLQQELDGIGAAVDVSKLAAILKATREGGDTASLIKTADLKSREAKAVIQRRIKSLRPVISDEQALASMPVPARDTVQNHRSDRRDADQRMLTCRERIRTAEQELARHRKAHVRLSHDEEAVAPKDVIAVRELRDTGWSLIRRRYVDGVSVSDDEIRAFAGTESALTTAYETAVAAADTMVDRRFDNAQAGAQIALTARQIAEQQELLEGLLEEEGALAEERGVLESTWKEMWAGSSIEPLAPDLMLEWLGARDEIVEALERREAAHRQLEALCDEESKAKALIFSELAVVTGKPATYDDQPLRSVIEAATAVQAQHEGDATNRRQSEERLHKMKADSLRKAMALKTAEIALHGWRTEWADAIDTLGLAADTQPESAASQLDVVDQMREIAVRIHQLRYERIEKIESDIEAFARDVAALVAAVATDLTKLGSEDAVLELERRLEATRRVHEQQENMDTGILALKEKIAELEDSGREARKTIQVLQEVAGATGIDQLKTAILNSDKLRKLQDEHVRVLDALAKEGDGLALAELNQECEAVDIDQVSGHEQTLEQDLKDLRGRLTDAAEHRNQTRGAFDAIGGDDRAAEAAAARQAALAELREVAAQYVRVRSAAALLQWAIERYRRKKQAPLLTRAGKVFATLTSGSFNDLRVEYDDSDSAQLVGVRPDGALVRVGGMSTGTADQLYLALRVASVEDYLDRSDSLPFVADDLFINFDNTRAAAGFEVLGQLSKKTQVLFFTHHEHLVEIAKSTLGKSINIVSLLEPQSALAA